MSRLELERILTSWAEQHGAAMRPMGRLVRTYKTEGENMHWHISGRRKGMGTLDVTYLPSSGRMTVAVHDNRRGLWAGDAYENLAREIRRRVE